MAVVAVPAVVWVARMNQEVHKNIQIPPTYSNTHSETNFTTHFGKINENRHNLVALKLRVSILNRHFPSGGGG